MKCSMCRPEQDEQLLSEKVLIAHEMWHLAKAVDKKRGIYDPENHITQEEILELFDEYPCCIWCDRNLHYDIDDRQNSAQLERLYNKIGHLAGNCVIACLCCNWRNNKLLI